jgi:hypothetical protein
MSLSHPVQAWALSFSYARGLVQIEVSDCGTKAQGGVRRCLTICAMKVWSHSFRTKGGGSKVHDNFEREEAARALKADSAGGNCTGGVWDNTTQLGGASDIEMTLNRAMMLGCRCSAASGNRCTVRTFLSITGLKIIRGCGRSGGHKSLPIITWRDTQWKRQRKLPLAM